MWWQRSWCSLSVVTQPRSMFNSGSAEHDDNSMRKVGINSTGWQPTVATSPSEWQWRDQCWQPGAACCCQGEVLKTKICQCCMLLVLSFCIVSSLFGSASMAVACSHLRPASSFLSQSLPTELQCQSLMHSVFKPERTKHVHWCMCCVHRSEHFEWLCQIHSHGIIVFPNKECDLQKTRHNTESHKQNNQTSTVVADIFIYQMGILARKNWCCQSSNVLSFFFFDFPAESIRVG